MQRIDWQGCMPRFIWNPSFCECECNKAFDVGEYLDYENCKCRKKLCTCTVNCVIFNNVYNQRWGWYLYRLLQGHKS